jgi:translation initiation factor 3 subunit F
MSSFPIDVKVHPTVLFSIIDSYERRNEKMTRVVGTLLGTNIQGNIEATDCFVVPHRDGDEVAIDVEFARTSYQSYKKVNSAVQIVGWFSTGFDIPPTSCLIHEYYARETKSPIHLTIDTTLKNNKPEVRTYCSQDIGIPDNKQGTFFVPIPVEISSYEVERLTIDLLQEGKNNVKRVVKPGMDLVNVKMALDNIFVLLTAVIDYVDKALAGKVPLDSNNGRILMQIIDSVPIIDVDLFDTLMTNNMNVSFYY